jgi:flagellar assembly protein FliH
MAGKGEAKSEKFLFQRDFGAPPGTPSPSVREALAEAEQRGLDRGRAEGRAQAMAENDSALAQTLARLADQAAAMLARVDEDRETLEREAIAFATAFAQKLAGDALARFPMDAIAQVARSSFEHLRGVPHIVVRVNDGLVEKTEALMKKIARERGFEGRLVIMGEPDIAPGDVRIEWADGGVVRDGKSIGEAVARSITAA